VTYRRETQCEIFSVLRIAQN